ncbi:LPXTG-motif cell wall-anchored protein [Kitasatospora sp. MAA19]|uniref:LPXTG cell wall anchor domain-containing protein n=1 Tax=Kitasatospora sp. MAA19 TaxID=3035090 RepID=UPI00247654E6|nr:LPXTG cell wall anchor domain-containing protein [Kitasatospora sp. MAA19]MDH6708748.1 LPXTG-motif cell wall-anchored protein [Kitasatospora sp. MAA19]
MRHVRRAAAVAGGAVAALALAGTGTAFAWNPSDASLEVGCRADAGHVELVLGNTYKAAGDYTLSLVGGTEQYHGRIEANGTAKVTVGYSGKGDTWRYTLADTHVDKKVADVPLCPSATPTPTGTPTGTPTPTGPPTTTPAVPVTPRPTPTTSVPAPPSATPSATTPTSPAAKPGATPGSGTSAAPALAQTGGGDDTPLALAGGAVLAAGAGLVLAARKVAAKRRA